MTSHGKQKYIVFLAMLVFCAVTLTGSAAAMNFELGSDWTIDMDTSLTYAAGWRVKKAESPPYAPKFGEIGYLNSNDGNENFDQWDMINNKLTAIMDLDIRHKNFGIFLRPKAFYDHVYMTDNSNNSPGDNNNLIYGAISKTDEFAEETEDAHGKKVELLDIFVYGNFDLAGRNVSLRVGRQVISWGESLFLPGGISSAQSHLDLTAANSPGMELKELFLPSESVYLQMDITENTSLGAYYQWKWEKYRLNESGSFFSTTDFLDEAGYVILNPFYPPGIQRTGDDEARDDGQFGVSFTYMAEWLMSTEFAVYYLNYHEKVPQVVVEFPYYHLSYAEDIKLYGLSFSSVLGNANISGEFSYRHDYPIQLINGYQDANVVQAQVSCIYFWITRSFCDQVTIMGEVGANKVLGIEKDQLYKDKFAWGYSLTVEPSWLMILPHLDVKIPVVYQANPEGNSSFGGFVKGADSGSIGVNLTYNNKYILGIKYTDYFNTHRNVLSDRDNISVTLKYSF